MLLVLLQVNDSHQFVLIFLERNLLFFNTTSFTSPRSWLASVLSGHQEHGLRQMSVNLDYVAKFEAPTTSSQQGEKFSKITM